MKYLLISFLLISLGHSAFAGFESLKVQALFSGKAMLMLDGKNVLLKNGETVNGITLVSADGRGAVIRFEDGAEKKFTLNQSIQQGYKKPVKNKLKVYSNSQGMFILNGKINGRATRFLVDTGATAIAISSKEADQLRLHYRSARKGFAQTASEVVPVWHIKLDKVKVAGITVSNVDAVVIKGISPQPILLGMSFLKHLHLQRSGAAMLIEQKY